MVLSGCYSGGSVKYEISVEFAFDCEKKNRIWGRHTILNEARHPDQVGE